MRNLHMLAKKKHVIGIENVKFLKDHLCGACEARKMTKAKHPAKTIMTTTRPFELLHMDLFGTNHYSAVSNEASQYGFVIVDDYSRYTWVHLVTYKHEVQEVFKRFSSRASTNFGVKIKHIRSDNGTEFKNSGLVIILMNLVLLMSYLLLILLNRTASWSAKTGLLLRWLALCLMSTKRLIVSRLMQLILRATSSTEYIFTNSSRRLHMYSSLTRNPM